MGCRENDGWLAAAIFPSPSSFSWQKGHGEGGLAQNQEFIADTLAPLKLMEFLPLIPGFWLISLPSVINMVRKRMKRLLSKASSLNPRKEACIIFSFCLEDITEWGKERFEMVS